MYMKKNTISLCLLSILLGASSFSWAMKNIKKVANKIGLNTIQNLTKENISYNKQLFTKKNKPTLEIIQTTQRTEPPKDVCDVNSQYVRTDHILEMDYQKESGWTNAKIRPISLIERQRPYFYEYSIANIFFETMKVFYLPKVKEIKLFRPDKHLSRFNKLAKNMGKPYVNEDFLLDGIKKLVALDTMWISQTQGAALSIKPSMITPRKNPNNPKFNIFFGQQSDDYNKALDPIRMVFSKNQTFMSFDSFGVKERENKGVVHLIWDNGLNLVDFNQRVPQYIDGFVAMNIFLVKNNQLITPAFPDSQVLPGVMRDSIIELAKFNKIEVIERDITIDEIIGGIRTGSITEIFGTNISKGITPIDSFFYNGETHDINGKNVGRVTRKLHEALTNILTGKGQDSLDWMESID